MDSSSDGIIWGDWGVGAEIIVDGRPEGVAMDLYLVNLVSM